MLVKAVVRQASAMLVGAGEAVQVDGGVSQAGHHLWRGAGADGGAVLVEGHVAHPVDSCSSMPQWPRSQAAIVAGRACSKATLQIA